ncbi:MAG TPA: type II secretion system protein [Anaerohalosphaeraceae bacterium]|nr:type II secretion system protein [Anaerohalosphaeraceae bacterium]HQG05141.1 type II secretion system protein [Anaerohalosphaeraceae bacterium]HQI06314.1 type II secretion system protein [Anaerohalosphaeraceae bacterium]HQJ67066.1 type II secretion system protein [Anaerohalosphaeraceae bacterium]
MTQICTAPMWNKPCRGYVLLEVLIVVGLMAFLLSIGIISAGGLWGGRQFQHQAEELVNLFQMAQEAAAQSDRRYAVILDFSEQKYVLRQFASLDLQTIPDEEAIIHTGYFTDRFQLDYVLYDDLEDTREKEDVTEARFYAGRSGWQYGGKVVVRDQDGNPWSILISRMVTPVRLVEGDVPILLPLKPDALRF